MTCAATLCHLAPTVCRPHGTEVHATPRPSPPPPPAFPSAPSGLGAPNHRAMLPLRAPPCRPQGDGDARHAGPLWSQRPPPPAAHCEAVGRAEGAVGCRGARLQGLGQKARRCSGVSCRGSAIGHTVPSCDSPTSPPPHARFRGAEMQGLWQKVPTVAGGSVQAFNSSWRARAGACTSAPAALVRPAHPAPRCIAPRPLPRSHAWYSRQWLCPTLTSCCWMSPPTTWTCRQAAVVTTVSC